MMDRLFNGFTPTELEQLLAKAQEVTVVLGEIMGGAAVRASFAGVNHGLHLHCGKPKAVAVVICFGDDGGLEVIVHANHPDVTVEAERIATLLGVERS